MGEVTDPSATMNVVRLVDKARVLVADNAALADWLKNWADGIADGSFGEVRSLIVLVENKQGQLFKVSQATSALDKARFVGLLHLAAGLAAVGQLGPPPSKD